MWWFILAFAVLGLELLTGTFYMLVYSTAIAAGGIMAYLGFSFTLQLAVTAVIGVAGTFALRVWRTANPANVAETSQNLDIGHHVTVETWHANGSARVTYRGTQWDAELESPDTPRDVPLYIKDRRGSVLILSRHKPQ
jgi:membrane protein implicated in regulation of membrane protease activity